MPAPNPPSIEGVEITRSGPVLELALDRPAKKNALTDDMVYGLNATLELANRDDGVRAVLLRATGNDFCTGFDIVDRNSDPGLRRRAGAIQRRLPGHAHRLLPLLMDVQVPVVVAAKGWVAGIGLHMVLAADFAVVAEDARLWEPFSTRGFTPDSGGSWLLPHRIGVVRARRMLLQGERIDGRTAEQWQMVHAAVPVDRVEADARALVSDLASGPTVMLGLTKQMINHAASRPLREHLSDEAMAMELSSRSKDFRIGMQAMLDRQAPEFEGR